MAQNQESESRLGANVDIDHLTGSKDRPSIPASKTLIDEFYAGVKDVDGKQVRVFQIQDPVDITFEPVVRALTVRDPARTMLYRPNPMQTIHRNMDRLVEGFKHTLDQSFFERKETNQSQPSVENEVLPYVTKEIARHYEEKIKIAEKFKNPKRASIDVMLDKKVKALQTETTKKTKEVINDLLGPSLRNRGEIGDTYTVVGRNGLITEAAMYTPPDKRDPLLVQVLMAEGSSLNQWILQYINHINNFYRNGFSLAVIGRVIESQKHLNMAVSKAREGGLWVYGTALQLDADTTPFNLGVLGLLNIVNEEGALVNGFNQNTGITGTIKDILNRMFLGNTQGTR